MALLARRANAPAREPGSGYSLLDSQLIVTGDIETSGSLRIDGRLMGSVRNADVVVIGVGAAMTGDVTAREVIVGGTLRGNVTATDRLELQPTAVVIGDVSTNVILVHEGGVLNGHMEMRSATAEHDAPSAHAVIGGTR
jgi:cytoskeletal protein CcmA (bactofilin family)